MLVCEELSPSTASRPGSLAGSEPGLMSLAGKRILVVEDDVLIALDIVSELKDAGCIALGPALRLEAALTLAQTQDLDAAVLDVFLEGAYAWQLAGTLRAKGVPFIFQTGFGQFLDIPAAFASVPRLEKPLKPRVLRRALAAILERPSGSGHKTPQGDTSPRA